ncbi:MAG: DUF1848 domain-containing protein [Desulfobacteraceae bacterium]|nr:MAG: DUF1848 domain-containing protein [Desulfobacteraceae bacterium]
MSRIVISASRRTDIPAFYMPWFMTQIDRGFFEVDHPFGQRATHVPAGADQVHCIVFWSKNFGPFLEGGYGERLVQKGYGLFFNFTINSAQTLLEPQVPPLEERLAQLDRLCARFGPDAVHWRFDPICFYRTRSGITGHNLDQFAMIAGRASAAGVRRCITSFVDLYRKVQRRMSSSEALLFDPPMPQKAAELTKMAQVLRGLDMSLQVCCEKELLAAIPASAGVRAASCIPNHRLAALYGPDISLRRDSGQRMSAGCGCRVSRDIGSYRLHPCRHNCLFCYANPQAAAPEMK